MRYTRLIRPTRTPGERPIPHAPTPDTPAAAMSAEERARLRAESEFGRVTIAGRRLAALLDEVDRLTEALEAADRGPDCVWQGRAERAEADLAELRAGVEALCDQADRDQGIVLYPGHSVFKTIESKLLRALLSDATTGGFEHPIQYGMGHAERSDTATEETGPQPSDGPDYRADHQAWSQSHTATEETRG